MFHLKVVTMEKVPFVFIVFIQCALVFGELCVLEPLVTISQPLCIQQACSNSTNQSTTTRSKRSSGNQLIPLVPVGSPSLGHFQSVKGSSDNYYINNRFAADAIVVAPELGCDPNSTYRTIDGSCNNLENTNWGKSNTPLLRILFPRYSSSTPDGTPLAVSGKPLPLPRIISTTLFPDGDRPWVDHTLAVMQWGQLIAHDVALSSSAIEVDIDCCKAQIYVPECYAIDIPKNDSFYGKFNFTCMNMIRTKTIKKETYNCQEIPEQISSATHYIDLSNLYGGDVGKMSSLRQFEGGLLAVYISTDNKTFFKQSDDPTIDCNNALINRNPLTNITCFDSGDLRVNQNVQITCLQNVFLREHNRLARELSNLNPNWTDETLFQESRKILIAQFQHISYKEWLPLILGEDYVTKHDLKPLEEGYTTYKSDVNGGTINSFAAAIYRIFHSNIQGQLKMYNQTKCPFKNLNINEGRCPFRNLNFSDYMNRPGILTTDNNFDSLLLGLTVQLSQRTDRYFTTEITEKMFHGSLPYGEDLESFDIQRGRDHGLPSYNKIRELCNLTVAQNFSHLSNEISEKHIALLQSVYENVDDIDLFVGSILEIWVDGSTVGPTGLCILGEQFVRKKFADRFWYEVGNQTHSFTEEQLKEIRKSSFSRLICNNSDNITTIQPNSFRSQSVAGNEIVHCDRIPSVNLTKWKE